MTLWKLVMLFCILISTPIKLCRWPVLGWSSCLQGHLAWFWLSPCLELLLQTCEFRHSLLQQVFSTTGLYLLSLSCESRLPYQVLQEVTLSEYLGWYWGLGVFGSFLLPKILLQFSFCWLCCLSISKLLCGQSRYILQSKNFCIISVSESYKCF